MAKKDTDTVNTEAQFLPDQPPQPEQPAPRQQPAKPAPPAAPQRPTIHHIGKQPPGVSGIHPAVTGADIGAR